MKTALALIVSLLPMIHSTVPPESYELLPKLDDSGAGDRVLDDWLQEFSQARNIFDLNARNFIASISQFDDVTKMYLRLRYNNVNNRNNQTVRTKSLEYVFDNPKEFNLHPLKPYFYEEVLELNGLEEKKSQWIIAKLESEGANSCPRKQLILRQIESEEFKARSSGEIQETINTATQFRSRSFRKQFVEGLVEAIGDDNLGALMPNLKPVVEDLNSLDLPDEVLEKFEMDIVSEDYSPEMGRLADDLRIMVRKRQCHRAKSRLISSMRKIKEMDALNVAQPLIEKVETCYRRKGSKARISFWRSLQPSLEKAYRFQGQVLALKRQGAIYWYIDQFAKAKEVFGKIRKLATIKGESELEAYALYTLGRVAENEGDDRQALEFYEAYSSKFKQGENIDEVLMSSTLLNFNTKQFQRSLDVANEIINIQSAKSDSERNGSALSFAYFWAGRAAVRLERTDVALAMWRRVASEYYSTFYGAMGHFMYEQLQGNEYHLEPSRAANFQPERFLARFSPEDRKIVDRAILLLKAGLKADANCEVSELLTADDEDNDRVLMKALLLHVAGDWLSAIQSYASLPRNYRGALPVGFERLLFPKAYIKDIEEFASKLNIESEMIYGIIRQESVFNPRARSSAGARGLMQLMPATARYESKRLSRSYLPQKTRRRIQKSVRNRNNLFIPRDNIALGVHHVYRLLKKYKNPVFVLTSYNANPRATERWKKKMATDDMLTFMERIPYQETRLYVKLVMRNYFFYKKWYGSKQKQYPYLENIVAPDLRLLRQKQQKG